MSFTQNFNQDAGIFVETTQVWDVGSIYSVDVNSEEFKELLVRLYQYINNIVLVLNKKTSGYYVNEQFLTSDIYTNDNLSITETIRSGYRSFYFTGPLAAGINIFPHGLQVTAQWQWTYIGGSATRTGTPDGYPIPYIAAAAAYIGVRVTATDIIIDNQSGLVFDQSNITLKYIIV